MVYVLNKDGKPLMPIKRYAKIRILRKRGLLKIVSAKPFTVQLLYKIIWTTLVHELRHLVCDLGAIILYKLIPFEKGSEENVEKYALNCFNNSVIYEDYKCFH